MYCKYCFNARVCDDDDDVVLTDDNDLSFCSVGVSSQGYRIMIRAGAGRPVTILFEKWLEKFGWADAAVYRPKYCPECGRRLCEYDND